jgi:hypothetical protein
VPSIINENAKNGLSHWPNKQERYITIDWKLLSVLCFMKLTARDRMGPRYVLQLLINEQSQNCE